MRKNSLLIGLIAFTLFWAGCGGSSHDDYYDPYVYDPGVYVPPNPNPNPRPTLLAYYDTYSTYKDTILEVDDYDGVLNNDSFPPGTYLEMPYRTVQGGYIEWYSDGSFEYEPPYGFTGRDEFTYTISVDSGDSSSARVNLYVE